MFDLIAFDADDTLWHNESLYNDVQDRLSELLARYGYSGDVVQALYDTEKHNITYFGYGIKSFTLSMIELAVRVTGGAIHGDDVGQIIGFAKTMIDTPPELLPQVEETLAQLAGRRLMIITKGDLLDQQRKLSRSRLDRYFDLVEVVSEKTADTYRTILAKYHIAPARFLMIGNSLKSDILPAVEVGAQAVYIPYQTTWMHEHIEDAPRNGYHTLDHIGQLPALIAQLSASPC
jgi:putative hydrolase of the HAD superfamily